MPPSPLVVRPPPGKVRTVINVSPGQNQMQNWGCRLPLPGRFRGKRWTAVRATGRALGCPTGSQLFNPLKCQLVPGSQRG